MLVRSGALELERRLASPARRSRTVYPGRVIVVSMPGGSRVRFVLLHTSVEKATRYFNGGRFWQIPSNVVEDGEAITEAICRVLDRYGLRPNAIWAAEHAHLIYNRRFTRTSRGSPARCASIGSTIAA